MMATSNVTRLFLAHNLRFEVDGMVSNFAQHRERFVSDDTSQLVRVSAQNAGIAPLMAMTRPTASNDWQIADLAPSPPPSWSREQYPPAHTAARGRLRRHGQLKKDHLVIAVFMDGKEHHLTLPLPDAFSWWLDHNKNFDVVFWQFWQETSGVAHVAYRSIGDQSPVKDDEWAQAEDAVLRGEGCFLLCNQIRQLVNQDPIERGITQAEALAASAKRAGAVAHAKQRYGNLDKVLEGRYPVKGVRVGTTGRRVDVPSELHSRLKKGPIFLHGNLDAERVDFLDSEAGKIITAASFNQSSKQAKNLLEKIRRRREDSRPPGAPTPGAATASSSTKPKA